MIFQKDIELGRRTLQVALIAVIYSLILAQVNFSYIMEQLVLGKKLKQ